MVDKTFFPAQPPSGEPPSGDPDKKIIDRTPPEPVEERKALVHHWQSRLRRAKKLYETPFRRMREDQLFTLGRQWDTRENQENRYVANVMLRHVKQRTAALYAKNPKVVARRRERMLNTVWDGTNLQLQQTMQVMSEAAMAAAQMGDETAMQAAQEQGMPIVMDAERTKRTEDQLDKIAETLRLLYEYSLDEQQHDFKTMAKMVVQRTLTTGVGYFKLGFQRITRRRPDVETKINDITERLKTIERLAADLADDVTRPEDAEAEQLRLALRALEQEPEQLVREGLTIDYPRSNRIIPDPSCLYLKEFVGCNWVAEEYILSPNEIKEIYGKDITTAFNPYTRTDAGEDVAGDTTELLDEDRDDYDHSRDQRAEKNLALVWEIYSKKDGLIYTLCEGHPDFLREPTVPDIWTERFWPWFPVIWKQAGC